MELDKRIEALTDILSVTAGCHDWELMTKKGYFANSIFDFKDLKRLCVYGEYAGWREHNQCFLCEQAGDETYYSYFLPESRLLPEEPEKKHRAFTLNEFVNQYSLGDEVIMRSKDNPTSKHVLFVGYEEGGDDVLLGQYWNTFMILFNNYELYIDGKWQPFGVIDEDKE